MQRIFQPLAASLLSQPHVRLLAITLLAMIFPITALHADEESLVNKQGTSDALPADNAHLRKFLLGDIGRPLIEEDGYQFSAFVANDFFANTMGGRKRGGGAMGAIFLELAVDTEKIGWWENGKIHLEGVGVYGRQPSKVIGDYQFSSSIDAPEMFEAYQFFYEHTFLDERLSLLAGIHDYTLEFAVLDYGWDFVNSALWTPATMTQLFYSFYPSTGLGTRARLALADDVYVMAGAYDGTTTEQTDLKKQDWGLSSQDGVFTIGEIGWQTSDENARHGKLAVGAWYNSGEYTAFDGGTFHSNYGTYLIGETLLIAEGDDVQQGLGCFAQVGQANTQRNFNTWYFGTGLRYKGAVPTRDEDVIAFAFTFSQVGERFREHTPGTEANERVFELLYRVVIAPSIAVTPDLQYVANPGAYEDLSDALVMYLRTEIEL
jgi:porin